MNKEEHINQLIDEAINSVDNVKRATPMPFLLTRIKARLHKTKENAWEKAVWFVGRPLIAIPALVMLILVNVTVVVFNSTDPGTVATEQSFQAPADDISYTVANIYDIENTEP